MGWNDEGEDGDAGVEMMGCHDDKPNQSSLLVFLCAPQCPRLASTDLLIIHSCQTTNVTYSISADATATVIVASGNNTIGLMDALPVLFLFQHHAYRATH